jgi:NDP-sugar pyrophosphorylase family protein
MRALLLAGGQATRLRPLTLTTPKAMTPVLGRPFLEHLIAWLCRHDVRDITLLLGYLADPIRAHFGDGHAFGVQLRYVVEDTPLGSGGAIKQLERELTEPFFALNADIYTNLDLDEMAAVHRAAGAEVTIALVRVPDPSAYGVAALDAEGWITRFVEKPRREEAPSNLVNAGAWLFEPDAVRRIAAGRFTMVEQELFPELARARRLFGHAAECYWIDAGTPQRYLQLHRDLLTGRAVSPLAIVERPGWPGFTVQAAPGVATAAGPPPVVERGGRLEGAVVLGTGTRIESGAVVRGPSSLGANVIVQDGARVAGSVLWDRCRVGARAAIAGSVLAGDCVVGTGAEVTACVLGEGVHVAPGVRLRGATVQPGTTIDASV